MCECVYSTAASMLLPVVLRVSGTRLLCARVPSALARPLSGSTQAQADPPPPGTPIPPPPSNRSSVITDFGVVEVAFSGKRFGDLLRAWVVLKLCGWPWLVHNSSRLLKLSNQILGTKITHFFLRQSFFGHFCGGETQQEIIPTINHLRAYGIGSIIDFAAEAPEEEANDDKKSSKEKALSPSEKTGIAEDVISARVFEYEGEQKCESYMSIFMEAIQSAAMQEKGFAAIKMTALGNPDLLEHISYVKHEIRRLFRKLDTDHPRGAPYLARRLTLDEMKDGLKSLGACCTDEQVESMFHRADLNKNGYVDYLEWTNFVTPQNPDTRVLFTRGLAGDTRFDIPALSDKQIRQMDNILNRLSRLAVEANRLGVRLMIDAEHAQFQPAIDQLTLDCQRKFNLERPIIFGTIQGYLRDSLGRVHVNIERARREGWKLGFKLVRGAYMVHERKRAKHLGYKDPVHATLQDTHDSYNRIAELFLRNLGKGGELMVATHNSTSVQLVTDWMEELNIPKDGPVYFGQLLGMCDDVSYTLGSLGYNVYKYVPYGPIDEVLPYLIRRMEENSDALSGATRERKLVAEEIRRRLGLVKRS